MSHKNSLEVIDLATTWLLIGIDAYFAFLVAGKIILKIIG